MTDPDLREAADTGLSYRSGALSGLVTRCLYVLRGPRRVGKTVALKQQIEDLIADEVPPTAKIRVAADDMAAKELRTLVQNTALPMLPAGHRRVWFFDEISSVTGNSAQEIKWLRDNDPAFREATVVLTGSNATALTEAGGELAGRRGRATNLDRSLCPMGFRTFAELVAHAPLPDVEPLDVASLLGAIARSAYQASLPWLDDLVRLWETHLTYGGFPRSVATRLSTANVVRSAYPELRGTPPVGHLIQTFFPELTAPA